VNFINSARKVFQRIFGIENSYSKPYLDDWAKGMNKSFNDLSESINEILLELRINDLITPQRYERLCWKTSEEMKEEENEEEEGD
jgi:hypothetical protein